MKVQIDSTADLLRIRFDDTAIAGSSEVSPGVFLEIDASGRVVGIEMRDVRRLLPTADLGRIEVEVTSGHSTSSHVMVANTW